MAEEWVVDQILLNQQQHNQYIQGVIRQLGFGVDPAPSTFSLSTASQAVSDKSVKRKGLQYLKNILSRWSYQRYRLQGKLVVRGHQSGNVYSLRNDTLKAYVPVPGGTLVIDICVQTEAAKSDRISVIYDYLRFKESEIWRVGNITNTKLKVTKKEK